MRLGSIALVVTVAALGFAGAGCGAPTDPTPNRMPVGSADYPLGPYGYSAGTTIANLKLVGKQSPSPTDYSMLPMKELSLGDLRKDAKLIILDGAARWCTPCNRDQPTMKQIEADYAARGVTTVEVLVEGGYGVAATEIDISRWSSLYQLAGTITIDPDYVLSRYADVTAFPVYMVVRASTMKIEYMQVGSLAVSPLEPVLDGLLAQ
ncbi:MAG: alkyl hydroperoxide reductase/Thiol specific antioxidant/Mal allergen [Myxococcales bacterium]|nr:alkyl hydroperoxide reductase/Thiol specific antioxidant/Mal allergen [Myxococcales bacterium]